MSALHGEDRMRRLIEGAVARLRMLQAEERLGDVPEKDFRELVEGQLQPAISLLESPDPRIGDRDRIRLRRAADIVEAQGYLYDAGELRRLASRAVFASLAPGSGEGEECERGDQYREAYEDLDRAITEDLAVGINLRARRDAAAKRLAHTTPPRAGEKPDAENCNRCGRSNPAWSAPSPLWNAVMRGGSIDGESKFDDLVCASCFMQLAVEQGVATLFRVSAEKVMVGLETTTPSGRVWDDDRWLWVDPGEKPECETK